MSLFSIAVLVLLFVRHRGNLARIWAGHRASRQPASGETAARAARRIPVARPIFGRPGGRACARVALAAVAGIWLYRQASQPIEAKAGPWTLRETDRTATGQQRVDRVAFRRGRQPAGRAPARATIAC